MKRGDKLVFLTIGVLIVLVIVVEVIAPRPIDWSESFSRYKRDPYACGLVYDRLPDLFHNGVSTVHDPLYSLGEERLEYEAPDPVNHVFVDREFDMSMLDLERLLDMVERGDNAFIAAETFGSLLRDTLQFKVGYSWSMPDSAALAQMGAMAFLRGDSTTMHFTCHPLKERKQALYNRGAGDNYFDQIDPGTTQVLAANGMGRAVFVRIPFGQGAFFLSTTPRAFTDYYLLREDTRSFMADAFSLMPDIPVLWSEFYKMGRLESQTPLRFILSKPPVKVAYWTTLVLLVLYVFVHAKRRQRAIPVVVPPKNTTKDFAETIGRLYYFKGDHADLARKMGMQFKEFLRQRLYLHRPVWDGITIAHVAERTGISEQEWQHAFRLLEHYDSAPYVGPDDVMKLDRILTRLRERL